MTQDLVLSLCHKADQPMSLGCIGCPERELCGGLHTSGSYFNCLAFCECSEPSTCLETCPNNLVGYLERFHEVQGFDLDNVRRAPVLPYPKLPLSVPLIYHSSGREKRLALDTVAVPLSHLIDRRTGALRFTTREAIAESFCFDARARLVISGVDRDQAIEDYWALRRAAQIPRQIAALKPDLVTAPNYSLALDTVRHDNLHNIKRIALCWEELVSAGIPTSLHLNARTDRDWERLTRFVAGRDEVKSVAFEFATGAARLERGWWYTHKLESLASLVPRSLQLVLRGGYIHLSQLRRAFAEIVFIDSTSFIKTVKRQKLVPKSGLLANWEAIRMEPTEQLDELLQLNAEGFAKLISNAVRN